MVLLRFAPSPTGPLHLGGLRTALYNHLYAKKFGGKWLLRIEDTDTSRSVPGAVEGIRAALAWAGLQYDYGPGVDGPHGPYHQSQRLDLYHTYARKLLDSGHAYRCFCSPDTLAATREKLARAGSNATYDKACRHLSVEEVARRVRAGEKSIIRLNEDGLPTRPSPPDLVFGALRDAHASLPTDPVLLKSDMFPTYHLASVVDDHEMGITHVLRGEEWLPSLPLHLDLYACLSITPPQFAHLPILLNPDGTKMSKRHGDVQVVDYMRRGWEPEAVLNWLALAGWGVKHDHSSTTSSSSANSNDDELHHAPDSTAVMSLPELVAKFDLGALTHRRNILDPLKLQHLNKAHLNRISSSPEGLASLAARLQVDIRNFFPTSKYNDLVYLRNVLQTLRYRLINFNDIPSTMPYLFVGPDMNSEEARNMAASLPIDDYNKAIDHVNQRLMAHAGDWDPPYIESVLKDLNATSPVKHRVFMTTLRHALTGAKTGPSVPEVMLILGPERTTARLLPRKVF